MLNERLAGIAIIHGDGHVSEYDRQRAKGLEDLSGGAHTDGSAPSGTPTRLCSAYLSEGRYIYNVGCKLK